MNEYGSFITAQPMGKEYFSDVGEKRILRFNAARYAISEAVKDGNYKKIWIPFYMCRTVYDTLEKEKIDYNVYHINDQLEPELDSIEADECILITNYAGIKNFDYYKRMCNQFENVIFDNTQAFFAEPIWKENVYNVYSPRKFFHVCDGAYLISDKFNRWCTYEEDYSGERAAFLLKAVEKGTNAVYDEYLQCEEELGNSGVRRMSKYTRYMLSNIDYEKIKKIRKRNFQYIQQELNSINEMNMNIVKNDCPMVYPLVISKEELRNILIQNQVYIPRWWKWVLEDAPNHIEEKLARYLLPIPIDQRYTPSDIKEVCNLIKYSI